MLELPESLTLAEARETTLRLRAALEAEAEPVLVIDGGRLERFDSSALAVLLECRRAAQAWGKRFELRSLPPALAGLASLYGLGELLALPAQG